MMITFAIVAAVLIIGLLSLIKPVNGFYDIGELQDLRAYCFLHADRAAQGENVVNDLIKSGLANSTYYDWSCSKIDATLESEITAKSQKALSFSLNCWNGNLTPSQQGECIDADKPIDGPICLYDEDVENWEDYYTESEWNSGRYQLTPEETSECKNAGYNGSGKLLFIDEDEDKDEDTKD